MEMNNTSKILAGVCLVLGVMVFMDGTGDIMSAYGPDNGPGYGPGYGPQTPNTGAYTNNNQGPAPYGPNPNHAQGPSYGPGNGPGNGPGYGPGYGPEQGNPQYSNNGYNEPGYNNSANNNGYNNAYNNGYNEPGYNSNGYNEPGYNNNGYGPQQQPGPQQQYYNQTTQSGEVMLDEPTEPDGW